MMRLRSAGNRLARIGVVGIALLLCLGATGCGYRLYPSGDNAGKHGGPLTANASNNKKVFVAVFTNNTPEANIETGLRNAFIDQFIKGRRFRIVNAERLADAVLKGSIKSLMVSPLAYRGAGNLAVEKRIAVTLALTLETQGTALWRDENFTQWADYTLDGTSLAAGQTGQKNALFKLANDAAERAYRLMTADF